MSKLFLKIPGASNPSSLTRIDRSNRSQVSKVIYDASCWNAMILLWENKAKTQRLETEQIKALLKHDRSSVIAEHVKTTDHNIKWDHFDTLQWGKTDCHCKV